MAQTKQYTVGKEENLHRTDGQYPTDALKQVETSHFYE